MERLRRYFWVLLVLVLAVVAVETMDGSPDSGNDGPASIFDTIGEFADEPYDDELLNREKWAVRMTLPSDDEISGHQTVLRSPYIVCRPEFPNTYAYKGYAVDFSVDSQPKGTYLCVCNWDMDLSSLQNVYTSVSREYQGVAAYAGFQVLSDGTRVAIMSVWDTYVTDANGVSTTIHATRTYPDNPRVGQKFSGEGDGIQTIVEYDWEAGKTYRAIIHCGDTDAGTCELTFYVCDLSTGIWDKLVAYDLGYGNTFMTSACCFLEDFDTATAASPRTMELSNFRANSVEVADWVSATTAAMEENYEYPGSYAYGSDGSHFWAITSGISGLCTIPEQGARFGVSEVLTGVPY